MIVSKSDERKQSARPTTQPTTSRKRSKVARRNVRFEASVTGDQLHLRATAPAQWFRVLLRVLLIVIIAIVILKMPELWQAIQAAIQVMPK
jgi:hypothetical protein